MLRKLEKVAFDVPLVLEDFIELKLDSCFDEMSLELSMVQDVQVCIAVVLQLAPKLPKERRNDFRQLDDPLGMDFTRGSLGHDVKLKFPMLWLMIHVMFSNHM